MRGSSKPNFIDTHCHVDLYDAPLDIAKAAEEEDVFTVAVTYLPSHYILANQHLQGFKRVKPALGLHPLVAEQHREELPNFRRLSAKADFIGEIGLDFSREGKSTFSIQEESFVEALKCIRDRRRFVTLHSRGAEQVVLNHLAATGMYPVVFHWFSGSNSQLQKLLDAGHYISINTKMIQARRWIDAISSLPKHRVLTETDGPFVRTMRKPVIPADVHVVVEWLAQFWSMRPEAVKEQMVRNFTALLPGGAP